MKPKFTNFTSESFTSKLPLQRIDIIRRGKRIKFFFFWKTWNFAKVKFALREAGYRTR